MSSPALRPTPPAQDPEPSVIIPLEMKSGRSSIAWTKVVLGTLVVFSLALAVVVWSQLLRGIP